MHAVLVADTTFKNYAEHFWEKPATSHIVNVKFKYCIHMHKMIKKVFRETLVKLQFII